MNNIPPSIRPYGRSYRFRDDFALSSTMDALNVAFLAMEPDASPAPSGDVQLRQHLPQQLLHELNSVRNTFQYLLCRSGVGVIAAKLVAWRYLLSGPLHAQRLILLLLHAGTASVQASCTARQNG